MEATEPKTVDEIADMMTQKQSAADEGEAPETTEPEQDPDEPVAESEVEDAEPEADEPDAEEEPAEEVSDEPSPDLYTVTVDGEEREVPLDELLRGYSGQGYVQKGMNDNAAKAKEIEATQQEIQANLSAIQQFRQQVETTGFIPAPQPPDPALEEADPFGYVTAFAKYQKAMGDYQAQQNQLAQANAMQQQYFEQQKEAHLAQQRQVLAEKFPELNSQETAAAFQKRITNGAKEFYGFGTDVLDNVTNASAVEVLSDAISWRELQKNKPKAQEKTQTARPLRPRNTPKADGKSTKVEKARARARKSGSVDDIAALLDAKG